MKLAIAKLPEFWRGITRNRDIERSAREWMEGYDAALAYCAEQLDQALSHAAGQEATTNPAKIGRKSVGGEAVIRHAWLHWLSKDDPEVEDDYEIHDTEQCPNQPCPDCIPVRIVLGHDTPAQPPASAEVGQKLVDDLNRIAYGYLPDGDGVDTSVALWAEQTLSRMAASSGRKGD